MNKPDDQLTYKLLKNVEEEPKLSQRARSESLGISLGKINYCLQALIARAGSRSATSSTATTRAVMPTFLPRRGWRKSIG